MAVCFTPLPHSDTHRFSPLVLDYISGATALLPFYEFAPTVDGLNKAIEARSGYSVDRANLVATLKQQYGNLELGDAVSANLEALLQENTFTICTAHQPNLLTGYLYFAYKILHAVKLAQELNEQHPDKRFVPVYYIGSEDNDLDELGTFRYGDRRFVWDAAGQKGAVGRMKTSSLKPLLNDLFKLLGPPGPLLEELKELLTTAYLQRPTIGAATRYLVHALFGKYGLIVLDPDDAAFKRTVLPILKDDLLHHSAHGLVIEQASKLAEQYKAQAFPRPINLFYLIDSMRERIEQDGNRWVVLNTDISWDETGLLAELEAHPERFSPNVILRGLLQETILPNIAFIGGGSEVAYWLQLKPVFEHYKVFFPALLLRQSIQWIGKEQAQLRKKLGLSLPELFLDREATIRKTLTENAQESWRINGEADALEAILTKLKAQATSVDATLEAATESIAVRIRKQLHSLEQKMYRAEKRKHDTTIQRIDRLRSALYLSGLQERVENFVPYYLQYGPAFFDKILEHTLPLGDQFLVAEEID